MNRFAEVSSVVLQQHRIETPRGRFALAWTPSWRCCALALAGMIGISGMTGFSGCGSSSDSEHGSPGNGEPSIRSNDISRSPAQSISARGSQRDELGESARAVPGGSQSTASRSKDVGSRTAEETAQGSNELSSFRPASDGTAGDQTEPVRPPFDDGHEGLDVLQWNLDLLERGLDYVRNKSHYTATFFRQENVNGKLLEPQTVQLKVGHNPFAFHMYWPDSGQDIQYVDGQNDGKMLVRMGGWKARLGQFRAAPDSRLAMRESRYPVTQVGLAKLIQNLISHRHRELTMGDDIICRRLSDENFDGRDCYRFLIRYRCAQEGCDYRESVMHIDQQWCLPLCIKNYGWGGSSSDNAAEHRLLEHYAYYDLQFESELDESGFLSQVIRQSKISPSAAE